MSLLLSCFTSAQVLFCLCLRAKFYSRTTSEKLALHTPTSNPAGQLDAAVAYRSSSTPLRWSCNLNVTAAQDQQLAAVPDSKPTTGELGLRPGSGRKVTRCGSRLWYLIRLLYGARGTLEDARLLAKDRRRLQASISDTGIADPPPGSHVMLSTNVVTGASTKVITCPGQSPGACIHRPHCRATLKYCKVLSWSCRYH